MDDNFQEKEKTHTTDTPDTLDTSGTSDTTGTSDTLDKLDKLDTSDTLVYIDTLDVTLNMECIDEIEDIIDTISEFEVVDHSSPVLINNRYRRQTWYEYFRKLYMISVILIVSIVVYFYYSYRRSDVVDKL